MNTTQKRLISMLLALTLLIVCVPLLQTEADAASSDYMTLEQAGAYLAKKMAAREHNFSLYFKIEDPTIMVAHQAWEILLNEAHKHTGDGKLGDALRWAQQTANYGSESDYNDGTTYYAHWDNITFTYYTSAQQEQELDKKVTQIISSLDLNSKSDYEKIKAVYEYVCKNVAYATSAIDGTYAPDTPDWYRCYSAYGALCHGEATCQGFSTAIYRLMLEAGIDCRLIAGEGHGWNIVKLDGKYYLLDATWDSDAWRDTGELRWFLKGSANFRDYGHREWNFYASNDYAKYNISELDYGAVSYSATDIIGSGECGSEGSNVTWTLTGDGTMTLTGTGSTTDAYFLYAPWQNYNGYIKKLVIGEGITRVGNYLFYNCTALTDIQFPSTLTTIGANTFEHCDSLTEITLPDTITEVGADAFNSCFQLKKFTVSGNMTKIPSGMLMSCIRLTDVELNNRITEIGDNGFANCGKLKSFTLPGSLTRIGVSAFASAFDPDLKVILTIPESVTYVGDQCFAWGYLNEVDWKAATPTLPVWTFYRCQYLEKVTLSDHVTSIGDECFQENTFLKEVELSQNLQSVGTSVFIDCRSLKSIELPASLTVIGDNMFQNSGLEAIQLHEGITAIGKWAFCGAKLTEVTFPASLKSLGNGAFATCASLRKVTFLGDAPDIGDAGMGPLHNMQGTAYFPYGNATWTEEVMLTLNGGTSGLTWKTEHPAGAAHVPVNDVQLKYDETGHWQECRGCDEKLNYEEHTLSEYMLDGEQWIRYCTTCWVTLYYEKGPNQSCSHTYDNACDADCNNCGDVRTVYHNFYLMCHDETHHWWECDCGATSQREAHYGTGEVCDGCAYLYNHTHTKDNTYWDDTHHWFGCGCGSYTTEKEAHTWSGNTCSTCGMPKPEESGTTPTEPPATEPPATEPPATEPPATEPPATEPPATEPPATEPPATEPPATEPPATEPPATEPPATEPPATEPPATEPPATEPPATEPPATEPPATEPSVTEPKPAESTPLESTTTPVAPSTSADEKQPEKSSPVLWIVIAVLVLGGTAAVILIKKPGKKV